MEQEHNNILLELVHCLWGHFFGMMIIFISIMVLVIVTTSNQIPIYEVGSRLMIKFGREYVYHSNEGSSQGDIPPFIRFDTDEAVSTEIEIIRSRDLVAEVVTAVGVETLFPKMAQKTEDKDILFREAVKEFLEVLSVAHIKGSSVLSVTLEHADPEVAVLAVLDLIDRYKARHLDFFKNPYFEFKERQVAIFAQKLLKKRIELNEFKIKNEVYDLDVQRKIVMEQYARVETLLIKERALLVSLRVKKQSYEKEIEKVDKEVVLLDVREERLGIDRLELELLQQKRSRRQLSSKYHDDNRRIVALDDGIKLTQQALDNALSTPRQKKHRGPSNKFQFIEREAVDVAIKYQAQVEAVESLQQQTALLKEKANLLIEYEIPLRKLKSERDDAYRDYEYYRTKLVESSVQEVMDSEKMISIVVIDKPAIPFKPIKPNKKLRLLVGLILAFASSFFYALFREYVLVPEK